MTLWGCSQLTPRTLEERETLCGGEAHMYMSVKYAIVVSKRAGNKGNNSARRAYLKGVIDKGNGGGDATFGGLGGCQSKRTDLVFASDCLQESATACHLSYSNVTHMMPYMP